MRCYSHLSDDEREQIGLAKAVGHSIGAIAKAIGRPKSTVSRELSRNKLPSGPIRQARKSTTREQVTCCKKRQGPRHGFKIVAGAAKHRNAYICRPHPPAKRRPPQSLSPHLLRRRR